MRRDSKLANYEDIIRIKLEQGYTYQALSDFLFDTYGLEVTNTTIFNFVSKKGIKTAIQKGRHDAPVCRECEYYVEVGRNHIPQTKYNIRVCTKCMEEIPHNVPTSPEWCSLR
jgi:hypothetical protein